MTIPLTNALSFWVNPAAEHLPPVWVRMKHFGRSVIKRTGLAQVDDYSWQTYSQYYGPENESEARLFTHNVDEVAYKLIDGRLYTIADAKPLAPSHRAIFEAILGLPEIQSVHEIGAGGGKHIVNLGKLQGLSCRLGASDVSDGQLALFKRNWPTEYERVKPFRHDITDMPLPEDHRADVLFTATVLMHIQRDEPYKKALVNLLTSARKYLVLMENWKRHDFVEELRSIANNPDSHHKFDLFAFDTGSTMALVVALVNATLGDFYVPVANTQQLLKYEK